METEKEFFCERSGLRIRGMQYFPVDFDADGKYPPVIVSHGFTGNYTDTADCCREFARMGYVAFGFSFCGGGRTGESERTRSDGDTVDMTPFSEEADLFAVKEYATSRPYVDESRLVLAGFSQGGFVSGLAAAQCGADVERLIMFYPALCIPDDARRGCLGGASYDPRNVPERIDCGRTVIGAVFHKAVVGMDPYAELAGYGGPVLILQGMEDKVVHYSYAVRAKECYREGQCRLELLPGAGHGFDEAQRQSAIVCVRQFLENQGK